MTRKTGFVATHDRDVVSDMYIALIVAIHRAGGSLRMTRDEYLVACDVLGVVPGQPADLAFMKDGTELVVSLTVK